MSIYIWPPVSVTTLPPAGGATSANQLLEITELQSINTEVQNLNTTDFALDATLIDTKTEIQNTNAKLDDVLLKQVDGGQKAQIMSGAKGTSVSALITSTPIDADHEAMDVTVKGTMPLATGAATEAKQDDIITQLTSIAGEDFATQTTLAALLAELQLKADLSETQPVSIQNASVPVTGTFWQATQPVSGPLTDAQLRATPVPVSGTVTATPPAQAGSFDEDATASTTPETFTAPAGAFACFIEADDTNETNVRVKMGESATTTSGIQFQPGRSEFYQGGSNISYCMESGTGKLSVQWFTR